MEVLIRVQLACPGTDGSHRTCSALMKTKEGSREKEIPQRQAYQLTFLTESSQALASPHPFTQGSKITAGYTKRINALNC